MGLVFLHGKVPTVASDLCSPAGIVLPGFVSTASAAESFSDLGLARYARVCVITSWYVMTHCNTCIHCGARRPRKSSHAHKQDIGAATRRLPKWTGLPPS